VGSSPELNAVAQRYGAFLETHPIIPGRGTLTGRVALEIRPVQILDVATDPDYTLNEAVTLGKIHSQLGVPLTREGSPIGVIIVSRQRIEAFSDKQVQLVTTFADQAVIAIENARLIRETHAARDAAETALRELQAAQASLVHAQKMAALGQLTAGIAHEIKNPLNFVNNFAGLSVELLDELKEAAAPAIATLDEDTRAEIDDTVKLLTGNLEKIAEHGQRADGIVRSMLDHSRGGSGERRELDLNALVDEALNLAYHGARAQDQSFNITMEREFDKALRPIEVVPQDVMRVFLNLIGNGFYAAAKRSRENADGYRPVLRVLTRDLGEAVEVRIRDNGTGISPEIRDKLFQPFVTTKPTGEGTGLGLSISYEIVTQQHGGAIEVNSEIGSFTEFRVVLPRRGNGTGAESRT
jgi:signal transduction histidine kinase